MLRSIGRGRCAEVRLEGEGAEGARECVMRLLGEDPAKFKVRQGPERLYGRPALRRPPGGRAALRRCASRCGATVTGCLAVRRTGNDDDDNKPRNTPPRSAPLLRYVAALRLLQRALFVGG